jgi:hypothetical protein
MKLLGSLGLLFLTSSSFAQTAIPLDQNQLYKIKAISNLFENGTIEPQYGYIEDIGDGDGITAGEVGFTSATGDLLQTVQDYVAKKSPTTALAKYIPCLQSILNTGAYACLFPSVPESVMKTDEFKSNLLMKSDFGLAWVTATADPVMTELQDEVVKEDIFAPTDVEVRKFGIHTAFGYEVIYDTILQMGDDPDTNSMAGMVRRANRTYLANHPSQFQVFPFANDDQEKAWLKIFILERKQTLHYRYNDQDIRNPTAYSNDCYRSDSLLEIWNSQNWDLSKDIDFNYFHPVQIGNPHEGKITL